MNKIIDETNWIPFLKDYSAKNEDRPTRLAIFELEEGILEDLWIEGGLPLIAVDAYENKSGVRIDIVFEKYVHPVEDGIRVIDYSDKDEAGLNFVGKSGRTTVLRFENWH